MVMRPFGEAPGRRALAFLRVLWVKVAKDDVFFMAGAVAFSILVAALPLLLLAIGICGYVLSAQVPDPVEAIVSVVIGMMPEGSVGLDVAGIVRTVVASVIEQRSGFTLFGALVFTWFATRLVGTLRVVLRDIFDVAQDRGILHGMLFDVVVVVVGALLLTLNLGVTVTFEAAMGFGGEVLGVGGDALGAAEWVFGHGVALLSVWFLFLIIYRYLPAGRVSWRTSMVAATFSAIAHEAIKVGFSWYATDVVDYTSTWGSIAVVGLLIFWIYYEAVVFILGGEIAHAYALRKAEIVNARAAPGVSE